MPLPNARHRCMQHVRCAGIDGRVLNVFLRTQRVDEHDIRIAADGKRALQTANETNNHEDEQDHHGHRQ